MGNDISCCRDGAVSVRDSEDVPPSLTRRSTPTTITTTTTESRYSIGSVSSTGPYEQHVEHQQQEIDVNGNRDEPQLDSPRSASSTTVVEAPSQSQQQQQQQEQPPQHTPSDAPPAFHSPHDTGNVDDAGPISPRSQHGDNSSSSKEEDALMNDDQQQQFLSVSSRCSSSGSGSSGKLTNSLSGPLLGRKSPPIQYRSDSSHSGESQKLFPSPRQPSLLDDDDALLTDRSNLPTSPRSMKPMLSGSDLDWSGRDRSVNDDDDHDDLVSESLGSPVLCRTGGSFSSAKHTGDDVDEPHLLHRNAAAMKQSRPLPPAVRRGSDSSVDSDDLVDAESFHYASINRKRMRKRWESVGPEGGEIERAEGEEEDDEDPAPEAQWSRPSSAESRASRDKQ